MLEIPIKDCCAIAYQSEVAQWLMGESFHPGGLDLTGWLGGQLNLDRGVRVLDVASGRGASALHFCEHFGCRVVGVDMSRANVEAAQSGARARNLEHLATFEFADAEQLPFDDEAFDAVICECAFCLFPDKSKAAREMARVLRPGGRFGMSDVIRNGILPSALDVLGARVACLADARPLQDYVASLEAAGLAPVRVVDRSEALAELADHIRQRLFAAEVLVGLKKLAWPNFDFEEANKIARHASAAIADGQLGYVAIVASKPI